MKNDNKCYFMAYQDLNDTPNIVVDGAASKATEITLSHWPKSGTPHQLKADSSAEIVFKYLKTSEFHVQARAVSNNHFDEDGLVGIYSLIEPEIAYDLRNLLVDIAHAGDFSTYKDRHAARVVFTISSFTNKNLSPLDKAIFKLSKTQQCSAFYQEILPSFLDIINNIETYKRYWETEDNLLDKAEMAINCGEVTIREIPEYDLAIVTLPDSQVYAESELQHNLNSFCHPMAINNATSCNRILTIQGQRYSIRYRYESWVQYISKPPLPRLDLTALAKQLSAEESGNAVWTYSGNSEIIPEFTLNGTNESSILPNEFINRFITYINSEHSIWDPYDR